MRAAMTKWRSMTWETKDFSRLPVTPLYAILMVILLGSFAFFEGSPPPSLKTRCELKGGEWLNGSAAPTCITASGEWLVFNETANDFLLPGSADEIAGEPQVQNKNPVAVATTQNVNASNSCGGGFDDYIVEGVYGMRPKSADFSTWPDASRYRTAISKDVSRGANFAGHYVVASWGCPDFSGCQGHAVIDAIDGKILAYGLTSSAGVEYRKDSRLLLVKNSGTTENYLLHEEDRTFEKCE